MKRRFPLKQSNHTIPLLSFLLLHPLLHPCLCLSPWRKRPLWDSVSYPLVVLFRSIPFHSVLLDPSSSSSSFLPSSHTSIYILYTLMQVWPLFLSSFKREQGRFKRERRRAMREHREQQESNKRVTGEHGKETGKAASYGSLKAAWLITAQVCLLNCFLNMLFKTCCLNSATYF